MKKLLLFLFLITAVSSSAEFKMKFVERKDGFNGFPVYTYTTNDYDKK